MHPTTSPLFAPLALLALAAAGCGGPTSADASRSITVGAASSLTDVITDAIEIWNESHSARARASFASSSTVARQTEGGAPFDVVVLADEQWMDHLVETERVDGASRRSLASGALVVVTGRPGPGAPITGELPAELEAARWTTADPAHVPLGRYAAASLRSLGWWERVQDRLVPAANARAALRLVERGEALWGVVYRTDAAASERVSIVMEIAPEHHAPITYPAAVTPDASDASESARAFLAWLGGDEGQALFRKHGFAAPASGSNQ